MYTYFKKPHKILHMYSICDSKVKTNFGPLITKTYVLQRYGGAEIVFLFNCQSAAGRVNQEVGKRGLHVLQRTPKHLLSS